MLPFNGNTPISESDKRLVESLYDKYHRLMLYVANQMLGDYAMAEDAVSESLIKMIRHREKLRDVSSCQTKAYIIKIVKTTSLTLLTQKALRSLEPDDLLEDSPEGGINVLNDLVVQEGCHTIMKAVQSLHSTLKDVAYLSLVHELKHDEIAHALDISVSASKKRLSRAMRAIKKILGGDNGVRNS